VSTEHVQFLVSPSQDVLPQLACGELDFVLIDGDHAFPAPFMDWYYTADRIREGGFVAVDDTQIPTGRILRDFLLKESTRWHLEEEIGKTAIFRRITGESVARGVMWMQQPYCEIPGQGLFAKVRKRILRSLQ
jgi:predicted O-methyltransferase YrrM